MEKNDMIIYGILAIVILIGAYVTYDFIGFPSKQVQDEETLKTISTGSTDSGDVSIDLTPIKIDGQNVIFDVKLNTHSVDLSQFDLKQITSLEYNGKSSYPLDAPKIEGHHSSGRIIFDIDGNLKDFTVKIKGIPKVRERAYIWKI